MVAWVKSVVDSYHSQAPLVFRQLFEPTSSTYTYLLADATSRDAVLIDPVLETVDRDLSIIQQLNLHLKYVINTHVHADHVSGSGKLKSLVPGCMSVLAEPAAIADVHMQDLQALEFGSRKLFAMATPGHTSVSASCVCPTCVARIGVYFYVHSDHACVCCCACL
ncbi:MBL fold metallo-hydrolase [archaeon]|nr:MAG: MBL fold metallo-hydrolase [archaeon]